MTDNDDDLIGRHLAVSAVRQALIDAAHTHGSTMMKASSAMFKAETYATNAIAALPAQAVGVEAFQDRVKPWLDACFGAEISGDKLERGDRLLEEVFELLQSGAYPRDRIAALEEYVWSREVGEPTQEVGGVMVTLAAYCLAHGLDMHKAGETELARVWTKVEKIRAKQAAKPKGSALPQAWQRPVPSPAPADDTARLVEAERPDAPAHIVEYTNWRGETARRAIIPIRMWWGSTEWHPEDQWMLTAWDVEKDAIRDFAWQDMKPVQNPATSQAALAATEGGDA